MGHPLVNIKTILFLFVNSVLNAVLLVLGQYFIAFFLSCANMLLIPFLFRYMSDRKRAALTAVLMLIFSTMQILEGYLNGDRGGIAFMVFCTFLLTIVPMSLSAIFYLVRRNKPLTKHSKIILAVLFIVVFGFLLWFGLQPV